MQFKARSPGQPTHQCFVLNLLPDQLILAQGITRLPCDGIDRALLHLLLDGAVQHEERLASAFLFDRTHSKTNIQVKVSLQQSLILRTLTRVLNFKQVHDPTDLILTTSMFAAPGEESQQPGPTAQCGYHSGLGESSLPPHCWREGI